MMNKIKLLELKGQIQEQYIASIESNNWARTGFLRGELAMIDRLLKEFDKEWTS